MSELQDDAKTARKRKNPLKDNEAEGLKVTASLRDQQLQELADKLEDMKMGEKVVALWHQGEGDRGEWLKRQEEYLQEIDEMIDPIYPQALDWSSTLHLPTILTVCKTYHARMYTALLGVDPPFNVRSRTSANSDRAMLIEELVRYTLKDWCNENDGIEEQADRWLWDWTTKGVGYLKGRWHKKFTRFKDVETEQIEDVEMAFDPASGESVPVPVMREIEREVTRTEEVFSGPMLERVPVEDVIVIGGEGDPQRADAVLHQSWMTASDLWSLADQKIFRADAVKKIIESGKDRRTEGESGAIKQRQAEQAGMADVDHEGQTDRYRIIEAYIKVDIDGSGIASDLVVWVHANSKQIVRATYLRRVMPTGVIPFFHIHFHHRHGTEMPIGLVELLYSLGKEIDAMHNLKIDVGILSSLPIGFYRPTASSLKDEKLPIEPGALIPVDNPSQDIYFPNLGTRTSFGFQEEAALMAQIERLTSISDLNLGVIGGQGATRTATGTRALLGEASNNLNIYIQRMNRGWRRALRWTFVMLQNRLEPGFTFRVLGDDGQAYFRQVHSREEIAGSYDFELEANSANSNKQIQVEQANMIYQMTMNPIDLQLGIITPAERYEAIAYQLKVNGIKDISRYVRKPDQAPIKFAPIEIINRTLQGVATKLDPSQDINGLIELIEYMMSDDEILGQYSQPEASALGALLQEAVGMAEAIQSAQMNAAAAQQQQMNTQASMQPSNSQPVAVTQPAPAGEGG
jgi:hypothetical protein